MVQLIPSLSFLTSSCFPIRSEIFEHQPNSNLPWEAVYHRQDLRTCETLSGGSPQTPSHEMLTTSPHSGGGGLFKWQTCGWWWNADQTDKSTATRMILLWHPVPVNYIIIIISIRQIIPLGYSPPALVSTFISIPVYFGPWLKLSANVNLISCFDFSGWDLETGHNRSWVGLNGGLNGNKCLRQQIFKRQQMLSAATARCCLQ